MKHLKLVVVITFVVGLGIFAVGVPGNVGLAQSNPAPACAPPPSGLLAWYAGEGNALDTFFGNNGTVFKGTTFTGGMVGQAFQFDGVDGHAEIPDSLILDGQITNEITVDAWINTSAGGWVFGRREPFSYDSFDVSVDSRLVAGVGTDQVDVAFVSDPGVVQLGRWQHIAITASTVTGEVHGYVNGVPVAMTAVDGPSIITGTFRNARIRIGQRQTPRTQECGGAAPYKGLVDELHIFSRALTQEEVQGIFLAGKAGLCKFCTAQ